MTRFSPLTRELLQGPGTALESQGREGRRGQERAGAGGQEVSCGLLWQSLPGSVRFCEQSNKLMISLGINETRITG